MEVLFHGHACFELREGEATVLIDPFLAPNNPAATASAEDVEPTHVLITHGHPDHLADAAAVAKRTDAEVEERTGSEVVLLEPGASWSR